MEAIVITLHGRQVPKLINRVSETRVRTDLLEYWKSGQVELSKKHQNIQLK